MENISTMGEGRWTSIISVKMSLLDLSQKSKLMVFEHLGNRMSTVAQLRLTCPQLDILAKNNDFNKVNAIHVILRVTRVNGHQREEAVGVQDWKIYSEIVRKKPAEEVEFLKNIKNPKKADNNIGQYYNSWDAASTFRDICEVKGEYSRMLKDVNRRLKALFEKVKSMEKLTIEGLNVTPEIVKKLSTWKDQISMVTELHLNKGECTLTAEQFTKFLQMFKLKSIKLDAFRTRNQIIGDCHLTGLTDIVLPDRSHGQEAVLQCPGITNESLKNWMISTPNTLELNNTRTSFTFESVWVFIQFLVEKYRREIKSRSFNFGKLDRNDANIEVLTKAMKSAKYTWKDLNYNRIGDELRYEVTYPLDGQDQNKEGIKFIFHI